MLTAIFRGRRPALWAALACAAGILAGSEAPFSCEHWTVAAAAAFAAALLARYTGWAETAPCVCCCLLLTACLGAARYRAATELLPADHVSRSELFGERLRLRGALASDPEIGGERTRFAVDLSAVELEKGRVRASGRVLIVSAVPVAADYADSVVLEVRLRRPSPARNPAAFDYRAFLQQRDIHAVASVRRRDQVLETAPRTGAWLQERVLRPARSAIREAIEANLSGAPAGLLLGMLLGEKYRIPAELKEQFRSTGLAHALVVSGLHVGLIALFFLFGLRTCRLPDRAAALATTAVLALYALITDLQPPVVRAAIMAGVVLVGRALDRQGDVYNSLGLAAIIILLAWPASLLSLSFQLSFAATLAIVGLHGNLAALFPSRWRSEESAAGKWLVAPLCVSIAAQAGTSPLIAYHFQHFAPVSLLANLAVVPLLTAALAMGVAAALTGWWLPAAATAFNACGYLALKGMMGAVELFASLPYASVTTPRPSLPALVTAAFLTFLLTHWRDHAGARKLILFTLLIAANAAVWRSALDRREVEICFLDVGQGDAAFLRFPNGRSMLIDGGSRSFRFDYGQRVLLPFLKAHNVGTVDAMVVSHPHLDHIGGLVTVLEQLEVRHLLDAGQSYDSWAALRLRELASEKGTRYHRVAAGDSIAGLGGAGILVLHPTPEFVDPGGASPHGLNNGSVAMRLTYRGHRFLFTGDAEGAADLELARWGERLQADVLKVGHHGSDTSTHPALLSRVNPGLAVISAGEFNKFGHPSEEVLERLRNGGITVLRTDRRGAAIVTSDGRRLRWRTMM